MDMLKLKHIYEDIATTIFGSAILLGALAYFFLNLMDITIEQCVVLGVLGFIGFLFLFGNISYFSRFLPGGGINENDPKSLK